MSESLRFSETVSSKSILVFGQTDEQHVCCLIGVVTFGFSSMTGVQPCLPFLKLIKLGLLKRWERYELKRGFGGKGSGL